MADDAGLVLKTLVRCGPRSADELPVHSIMVERLGVRMNRLGAGIAGATPIYYHERTHRDAIVDAWKRVNPDVEFPRLAHEQDRLGLDATTGIDPDVCPLCGENMDGMLHAHLQRCPQETPA